MNILVTGAGGLIGTALVSSLTSSGHEVTRLVRGQPKPGEKAAHWDPMAGSIDASALEGVDAVVHLAGENIAERWTAAKKARIRDSRVKGTQLLCETLTRLSSPPKFWCRPRPSGIMATVGRRHSQTTVLRGGAFFPRSAVPGRPRQSRPDSKGYASSHCAWGWCSVQQEGHWRKCCHRFV